MNRLIFSIVLLLISGAVFFLGLFPAWEEISALRKEIDGLVRLNDELQSIAKARDELTNQYNAIPQSDLNKLNAMLPSKPATSQMLREMEALAARHGLLLQNLDFSVKDQLSTSQVQLPRRKFIIPVEMSFNTRGSYDSLRSFLRDIEKMLRIVDISEISFSAGQRPKSGPPVMDYSLQGSTYYAP